MVIPAGPTPAPLPRPSSPGDAAEPRAGESGASIAEVSQSPRINLWSAWLTNGVRVHAKSLVSDAEPTFAVVITITGGELLEPPGKRGLADVAAFAWGLPKEPDARQGEVIRRYLESRVRFRAAARTDCMQLWLTGPEEDLPVALEVARVLLERPGVDAASVRAGLGSLDVALVAREAELDRILANVIRPRTLPAIVPSARPLVRADLRSLDVSDVEAWLPGAVTQGAIEVGIATRRPQAETLALAAGALGELPARPRVSGSTLAALRDAPLVPVPETIALDVPASSSHGRAAIVLLGPSRADLAGRRAMVLAAMILDKRAEAAFPPPVADPWTESPELRIRTFVNNPAARSGVSVTVVSMATERGTAGEHAAALRQIVSDLATLGPLPSELEDAKAQTASILGRQDLSPEAWADKLSTLTYDGLSPGSLARAMDAYQSLTAEDVRRALAPCLETGRSFGVAIEPAPDEDSGER